MDLRQLAALTAVADHGSFSAAARALHTVQSNVSTHIARLEKELRASLVDRATGTLTEVGEIVVARARIVQAELDALAADVASAFDEISGTVRFGIISTTGRWLAPLLLETMDAAHPNVRMVLVDASTTSLLPQVASGALDLALVNLPVDDPDLVTEPLFDEDRMLVCPRDHPLHGREHLTLGDLAEFPLILEPPGTSFRDELDIEAARAGVTLQPLAEVDGMRLVASLTFEGVGPSVLPASAFRPDAAVWSASLEDVAPRSAGIVQRRRAILSAPARALREVLVRVVRSEIGRLPGLHLTHEP
ncbi:MAG TPA: LysR family transcriptional regulator [Acidimicrobiales bacterium]|jgi:LysR family hydrogen peroxide-inducible transcriptional activator|nr:LysR family transcriptional regulator [Acidimicrobiales bacterium]